jgi:glycosyltransferase involved in cell wall biosynthesis
MRNEEKYIERCLASIFAQRYPTDRLEVIVLDGMSTDRSWEIAAALCSQHPNARLLSNPRVIQTAAWNLGIRESKGEIIGIVSAHSVFEPDYVSTAVETLLRTGADMVGGPMRAYGDAQPAQAIALATSTPFGVGGARAHYTDREEEVDTVYMGLCWRELYERIGGFDEEMVRNQDDELSYRLLKHGGRIVCNPAIRSRYYNRSTLGGLWSQYFQYGFWKVRVLQKHPRQMRVRQFVPPTFVAALLGSAVLAQFTSMGHLLLTLIAVSYVLSNLAASAWTARKHGWHHLPLLPLVFATLHISYGLGVLAGLIRFARRWHER